MGLMQAGQPYRERAPQTDNGSRPNHSRSYSAAGCESLRAIAAGLEELGIPAARGGKSSAVLRLASLIDASAALAIG